MENGQSGVVGGEITGVAVGSVAHIGGMNVVAVDGNG